MNLPTFRYHPDPVATGSVLTSDDACEVCGRARGFTYDGPVYAVDEPEALCPWCIADGRAHEAFDAEFTDLAGVGTSNRTLAGPVPLAVKEEVAFRTPGFRGWQQQWWPAHCDDACAFLGPAGRAEVEGDGSTELMSSLRADAGISEGESAQYVASLDREHGPTAYVFQCLHCGVIVGYSDRS